MQSLRVSAITLSFVLLLSAFGMALQIGANSESPALRKIKGAFESFSKKTANERIYIQTDKTFYKPGEKIWFSAFVRNETDLKASDFSDVVYAELISPRGNVDTKLKLLVKDGVAQGDIDLDGYLGGIYKLKAYTLFQQNDSSILMAEKEITIQSVVLPRVKLKLDFDKKAYGKGDAVVARFTATSNENLPLSKTTLTYSVAANAVKILNGTAQTDNEGKAELKFSLPKDLNTTDVLLNIALDYQGSAEAISRSVPVVLNKIELAFMPEGGDLVEGISSLVGFRALNEYGKPADVEGVIKDETGAVITSFTSLHDGMGKFVFAPQKGKTYQAIITKPEGVTDKYNLPEALANGYLIQLKSNQGAALSLSVYSFKNDTVSVLAQTRGKIQFSKSVAVQKGWNSVSVSTEKFPVGISQITLFDSKGIPRSERLVFVNRDKQLNVKITSTKNQYKPREKVTLNIRTTDEDGLPVSSDLALSVIDDNLLSFADDKQGNILAQMLLEPELKAKVHEPNFYFDKKEAKSAEALDNLLLTAGWRRYTWKQISDKNFPEFAHKAERAVLSGKLVDGYSGNEVSGAKITLKSSGKFVHSDKDGNFTLPKFDITEDSILVITSNNFSEQTQQIYEYAEGQTFYIYNNRRPRPMPMAAGAGRNIKYKNEEVMFDMVAAEAAPVEEAAVMANQAIAVEAMAADLADEKDLKEKKDDDVNGIDFEEGEVGDLRFAQLKKKERTEPPAVKFYRAKEFPKRVYAKDDDTRSDLQTTVYWNGHVTTDQNGKATVEFLANDLISSFRATAEGFGANGEIGRGEHIYTTNIPFSIDAKIPAELVSGDLVNVPLFLKNNTAEKIEGTLTVTLPEMLSTNIASAQQIAVESNESKLIILPLEATNKIGKGNLLIDFKGNFSDKLSREINTVAKGFPANISLSSQDLSKTYLINPVNVVPGSVKVSFQAFPNVMTELMKGIEAILREPYGCFEQTSSSNYPNIMVLDYMRNMKVDNPEFEARAMKLLDDGYKKLVAFETSENGYEWFGAAPAHEALTAYGLMEFQDMKRVYPKVDEAMIVRTRDMLLKKRDGKGGFIRNPRALDSFGGADEDITNAYIVYALTESGYKDLQKELDALYESARKSKDEYILALAANAFLNVSDAKRGNEMLNMLYKEQNDFGCWSGKRHSITRSTGDALKIETTSLVALAIMKSAEPNQAALQNGMKYLVGARNGFGSFGSTQSTILALKALTKYAEFSKKTEEAGTIEIYQNDKLIATKDYAKGEKNNVTIDGLEKYIGEGKQKIEVRFKGCKAALPYAMNVFYSTSLPQSSKECVLGLETKLAAANTKVGETVRLSAILKNTTDKGQPMSLVIIGLPAGLSAQPWQLKEMKEKGVFDFYEIIGNNIAVYYRSLAPRDSKTINFDLKAEVPGKYEAPASSAYLYYTNEHKVWKATGSVTVM